MELDPDVWAGPAACAAYAVSFIAGLWFKTAALVPGIVSVVPIMLQWPAFHGGLFVASAWLGGLTGLTLNAGLHEYSLVRLSRSIEHHHTLANVVLATFLAALFVLHAYVVGVFGRIWGATTASAGLLVGLPSLHAIAYFLWRRPQFRSSYLRSKARARTLGIVSYVSQSIILIFSLVTNVLDDSIVMLAVRFVGFCVFLFVAALWALHLRTQRRRVRSSTTLAYTSNVDDDARGTFVFSLGSHSSDGTSDSGNHDDDYVEYG